jgi:hypothetical protein
MDAHYAPVMANLSHAVVHRLTISVRGISPLIGRYGAWDKYRWV